TRQPSALTDALLRRHTLLCVLRQHLMEQYGQHGFDSPDFEGQLEKGATMIGLWRVNPNHPNPKLCGTRIVHRLVEAGCVLLRDRHHKAQTWISTHRGEDEIEP